MTDYRNQFLSDHRLPTSYLDMAKRWFDPIGNRIADNLLQLRRENTGKALILGISGCQGSGKSTLTEYLCQYLTHRHQLRCFYSSIDDFYLSKAARQELADQIHPLLATRGVPGTHRIDELIACIKNAKQQRAFTVPLFDKLSDDIKNETLAAPENIDIYIIEGWCIGATAQPDNLLDEPVNELESQEDHNGIWRRYVNLQLQQSYATMLKQLDCLILLKAPGFDVVRQWRLQQEQKLAQKHSQEESNVPQHVMNDAEICRFIQHYQRITEHIFNALPARANHILFMNSDRKIVNYEHNERV